MDAPNVKATSEDVSDEETQWMLNALSATRLPSPWTPQGEIELYGAENLYDLVNGQAYAYFVYGFEEAAVQTYENATGETLRVEIWRTATHEDAYGLYSGYRSGSPVAVGNEGDTDFGRRLGFWQDRYNVRLFALQPVPDEDLLAFAEAVAHELPSGGDTPEVVDFLPPDGLDERSIVFFHEDLTLQNYLWLGGENPLGLSRETDGVLARYEWDEMDFQLLLVQYPDTSASLTGLEALESTTVDGLLMAGVRDDLLGAVFGPEEGTIVSELLSAALAR
jgi:hypothetical protein